MHTHSDDNPITHRVPTLARWVFHCLIGVCVCMSFFLNGCRQINKVVGKDQNQDLLEAELRTREREILEARSELTQLRQLLGLYQRQEPYDYFPAPLNSGPLGQPYLEPPLSAPAIIRDIQIGTGTGGRDDDGIPGDEGLQVVLVPKDDDGTAIKVPGFATVTAYEISPEGLKTPIGQWQVTPEQLKKTWRSGLLSSGYFVPLQWDQAPRTGKVRVAVRFVTNDQKPYEADKDVNVTPLPGLGNRRPSINPSGPTVLPPPSYPESIPLMPPQSVPGPAAVLVPPG